MVGTVVLFTGSVLKADANTWHDVDWLYKSLVWWQDRAWLVVLAGPIVIAVLQFIRQRFGSSWAWAGITGIIEDFRDKMFGCFDDDHPLDFHRVTLFRHRWIAWPSGCRWFKMNVLVAVARSGHLTQNRISWFPATDDPRKCKGIAGLAYRGNKWVIRPSAGKTLPSLTQRSTDGEIQSYAQQTYVSMKDVRKMIRENRQVSLSFAAISVQVKGEQWGVIVLDSKAANSISKSQLDGFDPYLKVLVPFLERV